MKAPKDRADMSSRIFPFTHQTSGSTDRTYTVHGRVGKKKESFNRVFFFNLRSQVSRETKP